jgi:hypothetical protein
LLADSANGFPLEGVLPPFTLDESLRDELFRSGPPDERLSRPPFPLRSRLAWMLFSLLSLMLSLLSLLPEEE